MNTSWCLSPRRPDSGDRFRFLETILNTRLLDKNPVDGARRPRREDPRRPVASWQRFERTRAAIVIAAPPVSPTARRWAPWEGENRNRQIATGDMTNPAAA